MSRWPSVSLGDVASLTWRGESPVPGRAYRLLGVRLWGQGAYGRETIDGSETQYPQLFRAEEGDIVVNKIWARNGSVSVVNADLAGAYGSPEFPTYAPKRDRLSPQWAYWFTRLPMLWKQCDELSRGTSGQNRLRPEHFLEVQIPLPSLEEQWRIVAQLDAAAALIAERQVTCQEIEREQSALLNVAFRKIAVDAQRTRMRDVAPLVRRPVAIEADATYREIGARSFGRGLFHKPLLRGSDLTWQKLFLVEERDLVFSNIKAWEGAFAVARREHHGCVGSHRYLTCVIDHSRSHPDYIWFYLQSQEGLEQVQAASPGSADRNRTFSQKKMDRISIPLPSLDAQLWFVDLQRKAQALLAAQAGATREIGHLVPSLLDLAFNGEAAQSAAPEKLMAIG